MKIFLYKYEGRSSSNIQDISKSLASNGITIVDSVNEADFIVPVGGDGTMLDAMHKYYKFNIPFYGINTGTFGFLMNNVNSASLSLFVNKKVTVEPLAIKAIDKEDNAYKFIAINEVSILRDTHMAAHLNIKINNITYDKLVGDGVLVSTSLGSSAYNASCNGIAVESNTNLWPVTEINPCTKNHSLPEIVNDSSSIDIESASSKRDVKMYADFHSVRAVKSVNISKSPANIVIYYA